MKNQTAKWITAAAVIVAAVSLIIGALVYMDHQQAPTLVMKNRQTEEIYLQEPLGRDQTFSVSYTHSVNRSEVEEYYRWQDGKLMLYKARYNNFGAGVATELNEGEELYYDDEGFMVIDHMQIPVARMSYRVGTISDQMLHIGEKSWHLKELAPGLTSVVFEVVP